MLARLEAFYLSALRVIILVAATLALIFAAFSIISSAPYFLSQLGLSSDPEGGSLSDFISEQRPISDAADSAASTHPDEPTMISGSLQASAKRVEAYSQKHHKQKLKLADIERQFAKRQASLGFEDQGPYEESLEKLTKELEVAKGKPLTLERLAQLIDWHDQRFAASITRREASKGEDLLQAAKAFGLAGGALLMFICLVFCFLFVRIERNLRVVKVMTAAEDTGYDIG